MCVLSTGAVNCMAAMDTILLIFLWLSFPIPISCFYVQPDVITFRDSPQSQVLLENSSLVLTCTLDYKSLDRSLPLPSIKWQYNDVDSSSSCKSNTTYGKSSIVSVCEIELIDINDTGWYRCAAIDGEIDCVPPCYPTITVSGAAHVLVIGESTGIEQIQVQSNCSSVHLVPFELLYGVSNVKVHFDFFWEKDGQPISDDLTEIQILPSGVLLITNSAEIQYFGLYTCINEQGHVIKKYEIFLNESSEAANLELTVISSFSSSSLVDFVPMPDNSVELICHSSSVCLTVPVYWYYNSVELLNEKQNWLRDDDIIPGNYCCIVNSLSSCITIVEPESIRNDSISYLTIDEDVKSVVLLNCSTAQDMVHWVHNGEIIPRTQNFSSFYSLEVLGSNASSVIGVYQCLIRNSSRTPLYTHRILPLGLSNPPASVSLSIYRPSVSVMYGTHTITCDPPMYLGGLNITELRYKVIVESYDTLEMDTVPTCTNNVHEICNISCNMMGFWEAGYRVFYVQMTKPDGKIISQLSSGVHISAQECDVYVPATPIVSWLCTVNFTLEWQKSTIGAFFPDFEYTIVDLECFSGEAKIEEYSNAESPSTQSSTIQFTQSLAIGDVCSYMAYGTSDSCTGIKTSDTCTITLVTEELIISSTIARLVTDSLILTSLIASLYPSPSVQFTVISSPRPITSVMLSSADIVSHLESATSSVLLSTMLPYSRHSSVNFNQPSVPVNNVFTTSVLVASGAVIITLLLVGIFLIMTLAGYRLWKKSRRAIDWSGSTVDVSSDLNNNEVDVLSIITITDEILYNFDSEITNRDEVLERVREETDEERISIKERGRDDIATSGCSTLQIASADTSGGTTTSKTSKHSSISSLNHKRSAYSAFSESSGYSSQSEDYVDYSYPKHKLYYTPPYGQQHDDHDSERIEMTVLLRTDTSCPTILEQREDCRMITRDCFEGNEQELNVDESFTSSDEDLSYQNVANTSTASDFVRPCRRSHVSHCDDELH